MVKILQLKRATLLDNFGYFTVKKFKDRRFFYEHKANGDISLFDTYITVHGQDKRVKALHSASSDYQEIYRLLSNHLEIKDNM